MKDWEKRSKLYHDYIEALRKESKVEIDDNVAPDAVEFYKESKTNDWVDIIYQDEIVGFFITGWGKDCHPDCDYFIANAYIDDEYQGMGLMRDTASRWIKKHPGKYCMLIMNGNEHAQGYWEKLFKEEGYQQIPLALLKHVDPEEVMPVGFGKVLENE